MSGRQTLKELYKKLIKPWLHARDKKKVSRQIAELTSMAYKQRTIPYHYFNMMLYKTSCIDEPRNYLSAKLINTYQHVKNDQADLRTVNDKILFDRKARSRNLPIIQILAYSDGCGNVFKPDGEPLHHDNVENLRQQHEGKLFVKRISGAYGDGARIVTTANEILDVMNEGIPILFQPVIRQHSELSRFHPASLNSIRIDTLDADGVIFLSTATLKIGSGGRIVDNSSAGGMFVGIDLDTGDLMDTGGQRAQFSTERLSAHPETGIVFAGCSIPYWQDLLGLVRHGAEAFRPLGSIGWDVAITPEGPLIIEANAFWVATLTQYGGGGIANTPLGQRALAHHLGKEITDD